MSSSRKRRSLFLIKKKRYPIREVKSVVYYLQVMVTALLIHSNVIGGV